MSVFRVALAAIGLVSGLMLASFLMAAQAEELLPQAQMNRAFYEKKAATGASASFQRRPVRKPATVVSYAQMNRRHYPR